MENNEGFVISSHAPKTAGRSFLQTLILIFGNDCVISDYGALQDQGIALRKIEPYHRCVHGHFSVHKYIDVIENPRLVTWIRHPVDRVMSAYYYWERKHPKHHIDILDFIDIIDCKNLQLRMIQPLKFDDFFFIGVVEYYDVMVKYFCELFDIEKDIYSFYENTNPLKGVATEKYDVPENIKNIILANNVGDLELYNHVLENSIKRGML